MSATGTKRYVLLGILIFLAAVLLFNCVAPERTQDESIEMEEPDEPEIKVGLTEDQRELVQHLSREVPPTTQHVADSYEPSREVSIKTADFVVSWQMDYEGLGGWSKNFDDRIYSRKWDGEEPISHTFTRDNQLPTSSIDNDATTSHILYLAAVYDQYGGEKYKQAIHKAMDMILHMQHEEGSWGEMYPEQTYETSLFENRGTILQKVHYNNMSLFQKVLMNTYPFDNDLFDTAYKERIQESYDKGLEFIIKSQIKQQGTLAGWAGKYDEKNYEPIWARSFEPPAIAGFDTAMILFHLLSIEEKNDDVIQAIYYGVMWMYENVTLDMEYRSTTHPYFFEVSGMKMWYTFHDLETNEGIYAFEGEILQDIMDLPEERRHGYGWATERGFQIYDETLRYLEMSKEDMDE